MGAFRDAMIAEMRLRGLAERTQDTYSNWMRRLVLKAKVPADRITGQQVREFLLELSGRGLSASTMNQAINALRFFYNAVLRRTWDLEIHYQRAPPRVPVTLTPDEVSRLLAAVALRRFPSTPWRSPPAPSSLNPSSTPPPTPIRC